MLLLDLAQVLINAGCKVEIEGNPATKTHGQMNSPKSIIAHHTASPAGGNIESAQNVVMNGRSDLPGPLCNLFLDRNGVYHVISYGVAWHAGPTINDGLFANQNSIGIEAQNNGVGEPWPEIQVDAFARGAAALLRRYGLGVDRLVGHKEICYPKGRKVDPFGLPGDMNGLRARTQAYLIGDDMSAEAERQVKFLYDAFLTGGPSTGNVSYQEYLRATNVNTVNLMDRIGNLEGFIFKGGPSTQDSPDPNVSPDSVIGRLKQTEKDLAEIKLMLLQLLGATS